MRISCQNQMEQGIGIDLETGRNPKFQMTRFFLKPDELKKLRSEGQKKSFLRLWTVKEALFKSDPLNSNSTLLDYEVSDPNVMQGQAKCEKNKSVFSYSSRKIKDGFLTVAIAKEVFHADRK